MLNSAQNLPAPLLTATRCLAMPRGRGEPASLDPDALPIAILGACFDHLTLATALRRIEEMIDSRQPHYLLTANVDFLAQAHKDPELRRILLDAHLVLCDGTPLVWASRWLGNPLPERVAGSDLVPLLLEKAAQNQHRLFFLGATPESNARAVSRVRTQFPDCPIVGSYSPPFRPLLEMDHDGIARRIRAARPDILLVSFGCPKAEKWMAMHYRSLGVPVMIGVGATIDFLAGTARRAPRWMQRSGTEWCYRLLQEPRRLLRRYANDLSFFASSMVAQWSKMVKQSPLEQATTAPFVTSGPTWQRITAPEHLDAATIRATAAIWENVPGRHCLLDLENVRWIDSTGMALLAWLRQRLCRADRHLILLAPTSAVWRALRLMGWTDCFAIAQDSIEVRLLIEARRAEKGAVVPRRTGRSILWRGEINAANAESVWSMTERSLRSLPLRPRSVTIDMTGVRFIDSAGANVMLRAKRRAEKHRAVVRFHGVAGTVRNVLRLAQVESLLLGDAG